MVTCLESVFSSSGRVCLHRQRQTRLQCGAGQFSTLRLDASSACLSFYLFPRPRVSLSISLTGSLSACPHLSLCLSVCLSDCLSLCTPARLSNCAHVFLSIRLSGCLSVSLFLSSSVCPSLPVSVYLLDWLSICLSSSVSLCLCLCVCLSDCLSLWLCIHLSVLFVCLSAHPCLQALGMLFWHKHNIEKSLADLPNFTPFPDEWTVEDRVLFEQAFSFHGKSFHRIQQMVPNHFVTFSVQTIDTLQHRH